MPWRDRHDPQVWETEKPIPCPTCGTMAKKFYKEPGARGYCVECDTRRKRSNVFKWSPPAEQPSDLVGFPHPFINTCLAPGGGVITGAPLWDYDTEVWNETYLERLSHYPYVEIPHYAFTVLNKPAGWQIVNKIKTYNPRCKVGWYSQIAWGGWDQFASQRASNRIWDLLNGPPFRRFVISAAGEAAMDAALFPEPNLYFKTGWAYSGGAANSLPPKYDGACPDIGRIKEAYTQIWLDAFATSVVKADGFHADHSGNLFGNLNRPNVPVVDLASTSPAFADIAEMNASTREGVNYLYATLKAAYPTWFRICNRGNGAVAYMSDADTQLNCTGEIFEGWDPDQGFLGNQVPQGQFTFANAMARLGVWRGPTPTSDGTALLWTEWPYDGTENSTEWNKLRRYGLGSATIMGCYGTVNSGTGITTPSQIMWIADEYSVTPQGVTDITLSNMGWMGRPLEYGWEYEANVWVRRFQKGAVIVNMHSSLGSRVVDMGKQYKRIVGVYSPLINNGAVAQSITVPFKDSVFLMNYP